MAKHTFKIQRRHEQLGWYEIPFAAGTRTYCDGYLYALDSMYPSAPVRIVRDDGEVVRETRGRGEVTTNKENQ